MAEVSVRMPAFQLISPGLSYFILQFLLPFNKLIPTSVWKYLIVILFEGIILLPDGVTLLASCSHVCFVGFIKMPAFLINQAALFLISLL